MNAERSILQLVEKGAQLWADGSELAFKAPRGTIDAALRKKIRERKGELLRILGPTKKYALPSFAQERLWFLHQLDPTSSAYNVYLVYWLRGNLVVPALKAAFADLVGRHESLRTSFVELDGRPLQCIRHPANRPLQVHVGVVDLSARPAAETEALRLAHREIHRPFELARDDLVRPVLVRLSPTYHLLVLTLHHSIADAWSLGVLEGELAALYRAALEGRGDPLRKLALQYADFAHWQRRWLSGAVLDEQLGYWREQLAELAPLGVPTDRRRPPIRRPHAALLRFRLAAELTDGLKKLGRGLGASLFMTLLSAFMALVYRLTGQRDLAVGSPIANRNRQEVEGLIGFFVNTLVLRGRLAEDMSFAELVQSLRQVALDAYAHQDLPFEKLVEELGGDRRLDKNPLVQVVLALQNAGQGGLELAGLETAAAEVNLLRAGFDLELHFYEEGDALVGDVVYSRFLFDSTTIARLSCHLMNLVAETVAHPRRRLADLVPWTAAELHQICREWNDTATAPGAGSFVEIFEAQAARRPRSTALVADDETVSYGELEKRANRLAARLLELGLRPEGRVGLALDRSPEMIVALLAVLKAGGAYVPLDPAHPEKRLAYVLDDADLELIVVRSTLAERFRKWERKPGGRRLCLVDEASLAKGPLPVRRPGLPEPAQLSYVLYTSGSTGAPKGVMVAHASMANLALDRSLRETPGERVLQLASLTFDASVWEIVRALATGDTLHLARPEQLVPGAPLRHLLADRGIQVAVLLPAVLQALDESAAEELPELRSVLTGAEVCPQALAERWAAGHSLKNLYGPTEATVIAAVGTFRGAGRPLPIGRPVANADVYVLDGRLKPLPIGVAGELWIGGPGLARGYLDRPRETAVSFVPHPLGKSGGRLYRSGDRTRWLGDGNLDFLGRRDSQVKLRGYRIELGEVESVLRAHPRVREAVALVRCDAPGTQRLVAYVEPRRQLEDAAPGPGGSDPLRSTLRARLAEHLPAYMVPSDFVLLESFPRLASGKVDRRALPHPAEARPDLSARFAAPQSPEETLLAEIWAEVLALERVGIDDNFFELGGHSLLATRVLSRVRESFGVELELRFLFEGPSVAKLAARLARELKAGVGIATLPPVSPALSDDESFPLSFTQERLWFLDQLEPGSTAYTIAFPLRLRGPLDTSALESAVGKVVERHPALRARFVDLGGQARQTFQAACCPRLVLLDLTRLPAARRQAVARRWVEVDASRPFDLAKGPLFRSALLRLADDDHIFLRTVHHIVFDGWSAVVFDRELAAFYTAERSRRPAALEAPVLGYGDFAYWQRKYLTEELLRPHVKYWRERLGDELASPQLSTDRPRPHHARESRRLAASRSLLVPGPLGSKLRRFGRSVTATLFMTLLAGFMALLKRYTGLEKLAVATPVAGRNRGEVEGVIGPFVNILMLLGDLSGEPSFRELVGRVREASLDAYAHQEVPFERLVEELAPERRTGNNALFQILFSVESSRSRSDTDELTLDGLEASSIELEAGEIDAEMSLLVLDKGHRLQVSVDYQKSLFDATTIDRLLGHYQTLLDGFAADPGRRLRQVVMCSPAERQQILHEWNPPDDAVSPSFLELFERQARIAAGSPAVSEAATALVATYGELDRRAGLVASVLQRRGVGVEQRVALLFERSVDFVIAVLAVYKAGAAYVPLDSTWPERRLSQILEASEVKCLLTHGRVLRLHPELRSLVGSSSFEALFLDAAEKASQGPLRSAAHAAPSAAYVIFTSGSSGVPKGVVVSRQALDTHVAAARHHYELTAADRILQFVSLAFDVHVGEIFPCLAAGAHLVLRADTMADSARAFLRSCREWRIAVVFLPAAFWHGIAAEMVPGELPPWVRLVVFGGERVHPERVVDWQKAVPPTVRLCNAYGPTEGTVLSASYDASRHRAAPRLADLPIGRPIMSRRVYVVDRGLDPVPAGVAGELCLAGQGLARGYLAQPRQTAASFVPDPFARKPHPGNPGARLYRTGDLVRWRHDGQLEYLGRIDLQVKVRGHRVEPGEVESALRNGKGVRDAAVIAREEAPAGLLAYLVGDEDLDVADLRRQLTEKLPGYMIPTAFVVLESLPLTSSGKLARAVLNSDRFGRGALGRAIESGIDDLALVAPRTPAEEILSGIWCRVLGCEAVSVHDNFFQLGGHSLNATQVVARIRESFRVELPLRRLFELPTLAKLAAALVTAPAGELPPLVPAPRGEPLPPSFAQQRLWFLDELEPHSRAYNMPEVWELRGPLEVKALESALLALLHRHETLNATFPAPAGEPQLRLARPPKRILPLVDLNGLDPRRRRGEARLLAEGEASRRFDLSRGPLLRVALLHLDEQDHVLFTNVHHILFDGWSWGIFHRELALLYNSLVERRLAVLPRLPIQYADFAAWQRKVFAGERLRAQWAYWRSQLGDAPEALLLPTDRPRPPLQSHRGTFLDVALGAPLSAELRRLSLERGATLFMTLLAAFMALLGRHSGQRDIVVGSPIAGRNHPLLEDLIGFFVNNLVLRGRLDGNPRFLDFLEEIREVALQAYSHQDLPFEMLVEKLVPERDMSRHRLFQITFALQNAPFSELALPRIRARRLRLDYATARFDLELHFWETDTGLEGILGYNADIFDATTLRRLRRHFEQTLRSVVAAPEKRVEGLSMLDKIEHHQLMVEWESGPILASGDLIHQRIEAQAKNHGDRIAVEVNESDRWSYRELDQRANFLAHRLKALGVGPEVRVAICSSPRLEMVAAILAVLKAGGAYLPIDPAYPIALVTLVLEDAGVSVLLLGPAQAHRFAAHVIRPLLLSEELRAVEQAPPLGAPHPENTAYVIYTSGSTGRPKGVMVSHRNLTASTQARLGYYPQIKRQPPSRFLLTSSIAFDSSVAGFFGTLSEGGTLILVPESDHGDPRRLGALIKDHQVTRLLSIPALYDQILGDNPPQRLRSLTSVIVAGEACPPELAERHHRFLPQAMLDNEYGPTEGTVWATVHRCRAKELSPVPIGMPIAGVRAHVLDDYLRLVPIGVPGEIHLGGTGLARGYFRQPVRTAERFIPDSLTGTAGSRLYRTGDQARHLGDGRIELLGRTDSQVKIRGHRVELGEVEAVLRRHPLVRDAAVVEHRTAVSPPLAPPKGTAVSPPKGTTVEPHTLAAFVVAEEAGDDEEPISTDVQHEHVTYWQTLYEDLYEHSLPEEAAFDTTGWISSYSGEPIPRDEMQEWIDATCTRIHELCFPPRRPRRALEIGCGTGLIAFRLAGDCDSYTACDFSQAALDALAGSLAATGAEMGHVRFLCRGADETAGLEPHSVDTVIVNSVTQYFPTIGYLRRVLQGAVEATAPGGRIFVGDVRNLELLACFHLSLELHAAEGSTSVDKLLRLAEERRLRERELVVDPAFFYAYGRNTERISRVRLLPKAGRSRNELVRFRYDVVLELDGEPGAEDAVKPRWLAWQSDRVTLGRIQGQLAKQIPALGLRRIPDPRVADDMELFQMRSAELAIGNVAELRRALRLRSHRGGPEPEDVVALAREAGYVVELGLGPAGTYDALLRRRDIPASACTLPRPKRVRAAPGLWNVYANNPLQGLLRRQLVPALRSYLKQHLPEPMTPATLVTLAALPRTPNGKLDRRALQSLAEPQEGLRIGAPVPAGRPELMSPYVPPRTATERDVVEIFSEVLHVEHIGVHDDFFELGGHSLLATQVVSRIRRALAVELPLRGLFEAPTVARLAVRLEDAQRAGASLDAPPLLPALRDAPLPLSFAQERLWFLHQLEGDAATYHAPASWQLDGPLDLGALHHALDTLGRRHETLRTAFRSHDARPWQAVERRPGIRPLLLDLTRLPPLRRRSLVERITARELHRPFDLERAPLLRLYLLRLAEYRHVLLVVFHHIVFDGWSQGIFERELGAAYRSYREKTSPELPELVIQYADFAVWQRKWLAGAALELQLDYWRQRLGEGRQATFEMPTDRPRPAQAAYRGAVAKTVLPADLARTLRAFSLEAGASLFMTLLTTFMALGYRLTDRKKIVVGTPIANRTRQEVEGLIGFFVNSLVLDADLAVEKSGRPPSFSLLLERLREAALGAYAHQDLPFEKLVQELAPARDLARSPLFQVVFALHNAPYCQLSLPELRIEPLEPQLDCARFDLEWFFWEAGEGLEGSVRYDRALFDATTVERFMRQFGELLRNALERSEERIDRLSLLGAAERHQLRTEWNDTARDFRYSTIAERLAEQALRRGEATAVVHGERSLSYRELDSRSGTLAAHLSRLGVGPEVRVGILLERSLDLVVALVAVCKAGGAYVPLDPGHPASRLERTARAAGIEVLVSQEWLGAPPAQRWFGAPPAQRDLAAQLDLGRRVDLDRDAASLAAAGAPRHFAPPWPESLAYLIYTSGSTGEPKGVAVSHQALSNFLTAVKQAPGLEAGDVLLSVTTVSFDIAVLELFLPLVLGARVVIADRDEARDGKRLAALMDSSGATVMQATPATWKMLLDAGWAGKADLRILSGGEALPRPLAASLGPYSRELWNLYGPTEATVWSTRRKIGGPPPGAVMPIGRPIENTRLDIVDPRLELLPPGVTGEIVLGGLGLARGYHGLAAATAERFVPDPWTPEPTPGARLYRTGDLGMRLGDGDVGFLGRLDRQVKVRGVRIEPGEVEAVLAEHPEVREAVVVARALDGESDGLVAWLLPAGGPSDGEASRHVSRWRSLWEDLYRESEPGDLTGWRSSYTGQPIPEEEMEEWLAGTAERILALQPRRALEVGCGTGRVLLRVAPSSESYLATDFSASILKTLQTELTRRGDLPQVELREIGAEELHRIDGFFDTVVFSSVVQYFPSIDVLIEVLGQAVRLTSRGGAIYVGDVRSLPLQEAFAASVELAGAEGSKPLEELRQRIRQRLRNEKELLVDPAFFANLRRKWPRIEAFRIEPRPGRASNELSRFRYDVTLFLDRPPEHAAATAPSWHEWDEEGLDLTGLERELAKERPPLWRGRHVPNRRVEKENRLLARLAEDDGLKQQTVQQLCRELDEKGRGVDPEDLRDLGRRLGYAVELSWAEGRRDGSYSVIFHRPGGEPAPAAEVPKPAPWSTYGNDPQRPAELRRLLRELRKLLAERLPPSMWPASFGWVDAIPLTPSGKVDRAALSRQDLPSAENLRPTAETSRQAPRGRLEKGLAAIWEELLGVEAVAAEDDFFQLGGHSLLITQVTSRIRDVFRLELPVRVLFEAPTVASLARRIKARLGTAEDDVAVVPLARPRRLPLSWPQQRHWARDRANPGNPAFHIPVALKIRGPLSAAALAAALDEVQRRHEALRTIFPIADAAPFQAIAPEPVARLDLVDLTSLPLAAQERETRRRQREGARTLFDLAKGPLMRMRLLRLAASESHVLLFELHHIAFDAWSIEILLRETAVLYAAFRDGRPSPLPPLAVQYADFTLWQRQRLAGDLGQAQLAWWRERLAGPLPKLELPTDRPRSPRRTGRGGEVVRVLDPGLVERLHRLGREHNATLFMVLLAGFKIVLSRLSGQDDVVVGIPIAGRTRSEVEGLIGYFLNNLVLRTDLSPAGGKSPPSFVEVLVRVRETTLGAYAHQEVPVEKVQEEVAAQRDPATSPLFQVFFNMLNVPASSLDFPDATLEPLAAPEVWSKLDLTLHVTEESTGGGPEPGSVRWTLVYSTELFDHQRMEDLLHQLESVLRQATPSGPEETQIPGSPP